MFEFFIALKYLLPKRNSLSTALISLMSLVVISLVVWLVIVFLSVTSGIEKSWLQKLTSLHAPLRISPKEAYYNSYYYKIDSLSSQSDYSLKTIGEKAVALKTDPYLPDQDPEIPSFWPKPESIDPIKTAFEELEKLDVAFEDYEISGALFKVKNRSGTIISQMSYLLSHLEKNPHFDKLIIKQKKVEKDVAPIFLPKAYQDSGIDLGDQGSLSYLKTDSFTSYEHKIPVEVAGFYDPGLVSIGNKCILVPKEVTRVIHSSIQTFSPDGTPTNGIFIWPKNFKDLDSIHRLIEKRFQEKGIDKYFKIQTYKDFEFSKDLFLQFQSDRTLFLLIASIILVVACSNVISLLVLLVNDKKKEIAILQSMGATRKSIALIFGFCGMTMGFLSSCVGSLLAILTLKNLGFIVFLLSTLQGHHAFQPAFFGQSLPNELSHQALLFVLLITPLLSLTAGLIPALKAMRIEPSITLRSE